MSPWSLSKEGLEQVEEKRVLSYIKSCGKVNRSPLSTKEDCTTFMHAGFSCPQDLTGLVALEIVSEGVETTFVLATTGLLG